MDIEVRPVEPARWDDLVTLFGANGAYDGCWCMWWLLSNKEFATFGADGRRAALRDLVASNEQVGLLAYAGADPVGWCAVAPRPTYGRLPKTRALQLTGFDDPSVWSVVCFFVARSHRRSGVASALLDAAIEHAQRGGAAVVESYPVVTEAAKKSAAISTGTVELFARAGFEHHSAPGGRRVVMRRMIFQPMG